MRTEDKQKIGVKESNGADISGLERSLADEISIPLLRPIEKNAYNSLTAQNRGHMSVERE